MNRYGLGAARLDRFREIYDALVAADYQLLTPPTSYVRHTESEPNAATYSEMLFYDPDGVLVRITGTEET